MSTRCTPASLAKISYLDQLGDVGPYGPLTQEVVVGAVDVPLPELGVALAAVHDALPW